VTTTAGLVLAAGEGRRFGGPKAPYLWDGERLVDRAVRVLRTGGADPVVVVLGAWDGDVPGATTVMNTEWASGMGSSLRAGLHALTDLDGVLRVAVTLVDLPGLTSAAVRRVLAGAAGGQDLVQAGYDGVPGHPVVLGRSHWAGVAATATGDSGARDYLERHEVSLVEVGDLATGTDLDLPPPDPQHPPLAGRN
jgi:nicotine blue oxidoreductase